jgi:hypothetical protein
VDRRTNAASGADFRRVRFTIRAGAITIAALHYITD